MAIKRSIAFLCHPYHRGGVTRWMADAAIALAAMGHEVYFITIDPVRKFYSAQGRETMLELLSKEKNAVKIIKSKAGYEFEFGTDQYRTYVYQKLITQLPHGTPIILSENAPTWEAACAFYGSYPVIGVLHSDEAHYYDLAAKYFGRVDIFASVSKRVSKITAERIPELSPGDIYTIPCGIKLPPFKADGRNNGDDTLRLVYAGRISDYQKRTGDLVKIATRLAKDQIKFHLEIIGDGTEDRARLEQKVREEGLSACITFRGWLSQQEVAQRLSESDILVLTSDFEGTPIAMMEALSAGCGVVGTRVSGIEDYEDHPLAKDCYSIFSIGDIEEAVNSICKIARVPKEKRATAARQLAESTFTMQECLQKYLHAIEQLPARKTTMALPKVRLSLPDMVYSKIIAFARNQKVKLMHK